MYLDLGLARESIPYMGVHWWRREKVKRAKGRVSVFTGTPKVQANFQLGKTVSNIF